MLISLTLQNLALIDEKEISFDEKFNVITGETGAGKSLILDALSLCAGERADSGMVRHGCDEASVFGEFDVSGNQKVAAWFAEHDRTLDEPVLLIRRKISSQGRSKSWINGVPASISELKSLGAILVNIHSQHAGLELLKPQFVVEWLDEIGGFGELKQQSKLAFDSYQSLKKQAEQARSQSAQRADRMALLSAKIADIEPLLSVDFEQIEAEHDELCNLEQLMREALQAATLLDSDDDTPSVASLLSRAMRICDNHSTNKTFGECSQLLALAQEQIQEATAKLVNYADQQLPDEARLNELDTLLGLAHRLSGKYHTPIAELIADAASWQQELDMLNNLPDNDTLEAQVQTAYQAYLQAAEALDEARIAHAPDVCERLEARLLPLALPNARCEFAFNKKPEQQYNAQGTYEIALLFSANVGMPLQPLHKVASGGELSRIALVMQVMASGDGGARPTLVFDEVDVGISGGTAQVVGELLRTLGKHQQLLAITHQAQVAAAAHRHILVHKEHGEQTVSDMRIITGEEQIDELARMSGGVNITDATRAHVKSLLADIRHADELTANLPAEPSKQGRKAP
ncbi:DNA replication and repair protein RecN [Moraxella cuniculi DSM 21768]|uniref:DNA repair protein RecN n=1 Tax=Moraxella cuniculi DSM 21768 TaxID=1122245 RepID=A0A1N7F949_9GAMM|nr:DNA repair protein RecN [Moraxella cuniculi]OOS03590.1 DNA repair protein RecN [Moraxella cuniculi]SIR96881.1 DNA replication and repair protein RecN [Moraxella cuniculi DSM 21768]